MLERLYGIPGFLLDFLQRLLLLQVLHAIHRFLLCPGRAIDQWMYCAPMVNCLRKILRATMISPLQNFPVEFLFRKSMLINLSSMPPATNLTLMSYYSEKAR